MPPHKPKTLADFPRLVATAQRVGEKGGDGYTQFEIEGTFDRPIPPGAKSNGSGS